MESIVQPQVEKLKVEIRKDLAVQVEVLQDEKWIRLAWNLALQSLFYGAEYFSSALGIIKSDRKRLDEVWDSFLVDEVVENCFRAVLTKVLGLVSKHINWEKPFGIILFPSLWQAAVDQAFACDKSTVATRSFQVTASESDARRLQQVLSIGVIRLCNERICQLLQGGEIWNHPHLLAETIVPTLQRVVDEAYIKTLHFVDDRGDMLVQSSIVPVATYAVGKPTMDHFASDSMTQFQQSMRGTLTKSSSELASAIGSQTRNLCRDCIRSSEFTEHMLPTFVRDQLIPAMATFHGSERKRGGLFGRFRS